MNTNIMILSAGRRVELIKHFKLARDKLNVNGKILAVDASKSAPALYFADYFEIIPKISDDNYINSIIDVSKKYNISLIIPTIDTELIKLNENRELIESVTKAKLFLSSSKVIDICRDKINTYHFFVENGFGAAKLIEDQMIKNGDYEFPLFIRPIDGSSSLNTYKVNNERELDFFVDYIEKPIVNEFISGTEYSVDVFCDFDGNPITIVPRIRLAKRSGEISKGQISKNERIIFEVKKMVNILKPMGHITIQLMDTKTGIKYIEINPRFGGGAPMSIDAGANSCENIYRLLNGEKLEYNDNYNDNLCFVRFDSSIKIELEE